MGICIIADKTAVIGGNQFNEIWINTYRTDLNAGLQEQMVCPSMHAVQLGVEAATFSCAQGAVYLACKVMSFLLYKGTKELIGGT